VNQPLLTAVDIYADAGTAVVVAIGDSITEGATGTAGGWPGCLSRRLTTGPHPQKPMSVINAGIGGNQVLRDGFGASLLSRFDRDALWVPGVTHIVLLGGTNDIGMPGATRFGEREWISKAETPSPTDIILAYQQLIARARDRHVKIYGGTLPPFGGPTPPEQAEYNSPEKEAIRQSVNQWIRTGGAYDGVIDFEAAVRAPANPDRLRPEYDLGDHVHPSDRGHQALADAIDLSFFD
jgi:lysophospholipase L1-like esterase